MEVKPTMCSVIMQLIAVLSYKLKEAEEHSLACATQPQKTRLMIFELRSMTTILWGVSNTCELAMRPPFLSILSFDFGNRVRTVQYQV
jgi:hypothetical protein